MEDLYSLHPGIRRSDEPGAVRSLVSYQDLRFHNGDDDLAGSDLSILMKAQIATHPRYPSLICAYIDCRKVGAPPELASLLEEIGRENYPNTACGDIGADPELDEFMDSYCQVLVRYKEELSKPFDEATAFLSNIERQLSNLCNSSTTSNGAVGNNNYPSDEVGGSSDEEISCVVAEASETREGGSRFGDQDLKEMLLRKYSGYLSSLKKDFLRKRKKGKLPKDARFALMNWWNSHCRWPYPTEEEKLKLAETTGLDQKQINNWFINQRKRHWKPSDDMRSALMEGMSGGSTGTTLHFDTGTLGR